MTSYAVCMDCEGLSRSSAALRTIVSITLDSEGSLNGPSKLSDARTACDLRPWVQGNRPMRSEDDRVRSRYENPIGTIRTQLGSGKDMKRLTLFASLVGFVATLFATIPAFGFGHACRYIECGERRNICWPWPYVCADRTYTRAPFTTMVQNGWRRQNLLGSHHFDVETGELTTAGELKIQWIMTQAPPNFRTVFVERSLEPDITQQRIAAAREYASFVVHGSVSPQVYDTHLVSEGRPASTVDATNVRFQESMPPPVLPPPNASSFDQ